LEDNVSDFLTYEIGSFTGQSNLNNYDASTGIISDLGATGEEKQFAISFSGFNRVHFDVYGNVFITETGNFWEINLDQHDSTAYLQSVPELSPLILLSLGLTGLGLFRWRGFKGSKA
jgi:hypothetical protein